MSFHLSYSLVRDTFVLHCIDGCNIVYSTKFEKIKIIHRLPRYFIYKNYRNNNYQNKLPYYRLPRYVIYHRKIKILSKQCKWGNALVARKKSSLEIRTCQLLSNELEKE